ncbi:hypothetical protein AT239_04190 [Bartonella henselae]|nr:hypothetical protein AT239_04190 [Bartonella henselae]OLL53453.1 hypothetical protein AT240_03220 [Bartonella henselae]
MLKKVLSLRYFLATTNGKTPKEIPKNRAMASRIKFKGWCKAFFHTQAHKTTSQETKGHFLVAFHAHL